MTTPTASGARSWGARAQRVAARPLIALIRVYQLTISPLLPPSCRYYPSCSAYAVTALQRHGPLRGTWLAARRLGRCHPWTPGGVDHVPARRGEVLDELGRSVARSDDQPATTTPRTAFPHQGRAPTGP